MYMLCCSVLFFECRVLAVGRYPIKGFEPNVKAGIRHFLTNLLNLVTGKWRNVILWCVAVASAVQKERRKKRH
jgi:hypothetical protein